MLDFLVGLGIGAFVMYLLVAICVGAVVAFFVNEVIG